MSLPTDDKFRKRLRIFDGFDKYFPDAIAAITELSVISNDKHNPGEPLHWSKGKSTDHYGSMRRHQLDIAKGGELARDHENGGVLHATEVAWRACAFLQTLADQGHNIFAAPADQPKEPEPIRSWLDSVAAHKADVEHATVTDVKNDLYPEDAEAEDDEAEWIAKQNAELDKFQCSHRWVNAGISGETGKEFFLCTRCGCRKD